MSGWICRHATHIANAGGSRLVDVRVAASVLKCEKCMWNAKLSLNAANACGRGGSARLRAAAPRSRSARQGTWQRSEASGAKARCFAGAAYRSGRLWAVEEPKPYTAAALGPLEQGPECSRRCGRAEW